MLVEDGNHAEKLQKYRGIVKVKSLKKARQFHETGQLVHKEAKKVTEQDVREGERSLLVSHIRLKSSMETTRDLGKVKLGIKVIKLVEHLTVGF